MSQDAAFYRIGLIESIILLLLLLLAFGALTIMLRERWLTLGATESLLARLAASALVAAVAVGGLSGVVLNLLQGSAFSDTTLSAPTSRNQALLGIALALAFTIVGIIRIEMYHRHLLSPPVQEDDADWRVEPRR
ncbi:MAG TPA: hypothetical protein VN961_18200 [Streptosporangiaceae bacterium]|nr:hypothetical protein [Streptosporangiaceae bacterium]